MNVVLRANDKVSIPIGFSSSLQPEIPSPSIYGRIRFQSLSGFQVRCNSSRDESTAQTPSRFQSLSGFQVRCNFASFCKTPEEIKSFNPYRVFKFVATFCIKLGLCELDKFQSLSGFQVRCNTQLLGLIEPLLLSFNPYRVFKFVAT